MFDVRVIALVCRLPASDGKQGLPRSDHPPAPNFSQVKWTNETHVGCVDASANSYLTQRSNRRSARSGSAGG